MARINPNAMNTLRIYTVRLDEEIVYMNSFMRFGVSKSIVDNTHSGGIFCGIGNDGRLSQKAYDVNYKPYDEHPITKIKFCDVKIAQFEQIKEKTKLMHKKLPYFRFVSWDIGIDENKEICLVEVNLRHQDIKAFQALNGPLFGEYTDRILEETFGSKILASKFK